MEANLARVYLYNSWTDGPMYAGVYCKNILF
jgi:hypothetical protein